MHSKGKGISASALPYRRSQPSWSKITPEEVSEQIFKLARRGLTPSQIGVVLRDSHGVPQVKFVTGNKILRILRTTGESSLSREETSGCSCETIGLGPSLPEDLYHLIKKAVSVRKHLERNRGDKDAKL